MPCLEKICLRFSQFGPQAPMQKRPRADILPVRSRVSLVNKMFITWWKIAVWKSLMITYWKDTVRAIFTGSRFSVHRVWRFFVFFSDFAVFFAIYDFSSRKRQESSIEKKKESHVFFFSFFTNVSFNPPENPRVCLHGIIQDSAWSNT